MTNKRQPKGQRGDLAGLAFTLALGTAGGALFYRLGTPLPWMLGSLFACLFGSILRLRLRSSDKLRVPMTAIVGTMMGASFTPGLMSSIPTWWVPLLGLLVFMVAATLCCFLYFRFLVRFDNPTAFFSSLPGGLVEMMMIGEASGAEMKRVVLVHASRIVFTVFSVPFLVQLLTGGPINRGLGAGISVREMPGADVALLLLVMCAGLLLSRMVPMLPARTLLCPLFISLVMHMTGAVEFKTPREFLIVAQIVIGSSVGCRFVGARPSEVLGILGCSFGSAVILIALGLGLAMLLSSASGHPVSELLLSYSPGGLAEMGILAVALHLEVAMVSTHHAIRILILVLAATIIANLGFKKKKPS